VNLDQLTCTDDSQHAINLNLYLLIAGYNRRYRQLDKANTHINTPFSTFYTLINVIIWLRYLFWSTITKV